MTDRIAVAICDLDVGQPFVLDNLYYIVLSHGKDRSYAQEVSSRKEHALSRVLPVVPVRLEEVQRLETTLSRGETRFQRLKSEYLAKKGGG